MRVIPTMVSIAVACSLASSSAHADDWYGYETLTVDAAAIAMTTRAQDDAVLVGFLAYLAGAPLVHAAHGENARAGWSLGARILVPLVAAGVGNGLLDDGFGIGAALGAVVGILGTIVVDGALARTDEDERAAGREVMLAYGGGF